MEVRMSILHGDGSQYWARSMSIAEARALRNTDNDRENLLVWLNDDVDLDDDALSRIVESHDRHPDAVIVGSLRDPDSSVVTYGGLRRTGIHPLKFSLVPPSSQEQPLDTFNGNFLVLTFSTARRLGGIDGEFSHALADIDYGLRCRRLGVPALLAPGTFGNCARNPSERYTRIGLAWRDFIGIKGGGNYDSLRRILRKSHPSSWWFFIFSTYLKWWVLALPRKLYAIGRGW